MEISDKKTKIYNYIIQGDLSASKIAKLLGVSRAYVSKVIKQLLTENCIIEVRYHGNSCKPKVYTKSKGEYEAKLTKLTSGVLPKAIEQPRIHLIVLQYQVTSKPGVEVDGSVFYANNTKFVDYKHVFDFGSVTFRLIQDSKLVVFMPGFFTSDINFRNEKQIIYSKAQELSNWFCKRFHCSLGLPELYQDPHIALAEHDPFLEEFCQNYGMVKLSDQDGNVISWWDRSKGHLEFETRDGRQAEIKAFMPVIIENLQDRVFHLNSEMAAQGLVIEALEAKINSITGSVDVIMKEVLNIKKMVDSNLESSPDSYIDVA